jgi:GLPGLI family protein
MNYNKLFVFFLLLNTQLLSQSIPNTLFVKYQRLNETDGYNQWFTTTGTFYSWLANETPPVNVPVIVDDKLIFTSDTVLYKNEIKDFIKKATEDARKQKQQVFYRSNFSDLLIYSGISFDNKVFLITDSLQPMTNWEVISDTTIILGFKCQKAVTNYYGTNFEAYFTTEFEFSGGPKNFRGLPGIILKVENLQTKTGYMAIELQYPYKDKIPKIPDEGIPITKSEFMKRQEKVKPDNK